MIIYCSTCLSWFIFLKLFSVFLSYLNTFPFYYFSMCQSSFLTFSSLTEPERTRHSVVFVLPKKNVIKMYSLLLGMLTRFRSMLYKQKLGCNHPTQVGEIRDAASSWTYYRINWMVAPWNHESSSLAIPFKHISRLQQFYSVRRLRAVIWCIVAERPLKGPGRRICNCIWERWKF